jgi:Cys-tRNA(Pro)/Cys-tRNA(Cys) deacylase
MRGLLDITRELIAAEVLHEVVHLRRRIDDAVELPEVLGLPGTACLAVRLYDVTPDGDAPPGLVAAFLPADAAPATAALARAAGARSVRAIPAPRVSLVTDFHPSLVPPVGLPREIAVVAHAGLADQEVVYAPTGDGGTALKIRTADLLALSGATLAPLVEPGVVLDVQRPGAEDGWRAGPLAAGASLLR